MYVFRFTSEFSWHFRPCVSVLQAEPWKMMRQDVAAWYHLPAKPPRPPGRHTGSVWLITRICLGASGRLYQLQCGTMNSVRAARCLAVASVFAALLLSDSISDNSAVIVRGWAGATTAGLKMTLHPSNPSIQPTKELSGTNLIITPTTVFPAK